MAASRGPSVSEAELEVLKVLWEQGAGTVRDVLGWLEPTGRGWAYNTVLTLLQRLEHKGYVASNKRNIPHRFRATVSREGFLGQRLHELAEQICSGSLSPLLSALVERQEFSADDLARFRQLLDRLEEES